MGKKITRSSVAMVIQNFTGLMYGMILLLSGIAEIFFAQNFFSLIFSLSISPLIVLLAAKSGVFRNLRFQSLFTGECNQAMTEFMYRSSILLMLMLVVLGVNLYEIIAVGFLLLQLILSRVKQYYGLETDYLNILQGCALLEVGGAVLSVLPYISVSVFEEIFELLADLISLSWESIGALIWGIGLVTFLVYIPQMVTKLIGVSHGAGHHLILTLISFSCNTVSGLIFVLCGSIKISGAHVLLSSLGTGLIFLGELASVLLCRKFCGSLHEEARAAIRAGKRYEDIVICWDKWKIKKWNVGTVIVLLVAMCAFHAVIDSLFFVSMAFRVWDPDLPFSKVLSHLQFNGELENLLLLPGDGGSYLMGTVALQHVKLLLLAAFVTNCIGLNGKYHTEKRDLLPASTGARIGILIPYAMIMALPYILNAFFIFFSAILSTQMSLILFIVTNLVIYYMFSSFLLDKLKVGKLLKIWLPTLIFLGGEGMTWLMEKGAQALFGFGAIFPKLHYGIADSVYQRESLVLAVIVIYSCVVISGLIYQLTHKIFVSVIHSFAFISFYNYSTSILMNVKPLLILCCIVTVIIGIYVIVRLHLRKPSEERELPTAE